MTDAGWAEKKAVKLCERWFDTGARASWCPKMTNEFASALKQEHARSVRIVKKVRWAKRPIMKSHPDDVWFKGYETACNEILTALQRGRGGNG